MQTTDGMIAAASAAGAVVVAVGAAVIAGGIGDTEVDGTAAGVVVATAADDVVFADVVVGCAVLFAVPHPARAQVRPTRTTSRREFETVGR
ncbi:hypothetical protein [Nocardia seriolae]|uniref:Uncharacterized protein n=1 Tax=Nocardia seriolae TaxID=37332 RepID=A0ABC9Z4W9_9NOCA|nr:hypothetical protein [Nocardia seriolae]OJF82216.1 hypothetical protein NS14008_27540 [Nocardia seriolae]WKY54077.1 hypothetical protein Q5P07_08440 [Nocardia seriolae]WNJ60855.1 hypothetical protein RMO66_09160 [Nocardia seriolae]BAW09149.1 conserved hypothetical protein [Nocardia seriolae]BEK86005.1 hypothetical protein NSERKGN1266_19560 [Nocardia seriolae]